MNDTYIVTSYVVMDDLLKAMHYRDDPRATISAAEVMTVAVVAARYFQNHHERALCLLQRLGDIPRVSVSRFNRRLHHLVDTVSELLDWLMTLLPYNDLFIIDSMPLPVCKLVRAPRCRKVQGKVFRGYCAAKKEYFFGFKLHLVCAVSGLPASFEVLPASFHDLTAVHDLSGALPPGARLLGDKGYNCDYDENLAYLFAQIELIPRHRANMLPNYSEHQSLLRRYRSVIETVNSQLEKMGIQRLHARTLTGFLLKVYASLLALLFNPFV